MVFTTWVFALFMAAVFVCYWWVVQARWRRAFLLGSSFAYFTYSYPPYSLLLATLTAFVYTVGRLIISWRHEGNRQPAKIALVAGLVVCAGTLAVFKYSSMAVSTWNAFSHALDADAALPLPKLLVPIGISFFTFEFIHYLTDIYFGRVERASALDFSVFAFFFPSLISGPIKRFQVFQEQSGTIGRFQVAYLSEGLHRIVLGLGKKIVIADTADLFTAALRHPESSTRIALWIAMYAYAVKIYYDFSGYTDIAIGCANLLGYRLPENFNRPYRQPNLGKFWNNWHMSLSSWIRDYLFIPLGGSRAGKLRTLFNLTVVMAICGLWHGANWNFVVWGLWNGLGLALLRVYQSAIPPMPDRRSLRWLSTALTIQFVCVGWVFFASPSLGAALVSLRRMV